MGLSNYSITEEGYKALASTLRSSPSHLIELDLTGNDPGHSGVKELSDLLQDGCCKLKTIRFLKSPAAEEVCQYFTEVLGKSPLLLKELDLSEDKLEDLDWEKLSALLMDSHSKVEKLMLNNCELTEKSCSVLATVLSSKTFLKELNLNNSRLLDSGVKEICEGLKNPVCELKILKLSKCSLTEESCSDLASVLSSDSSSLKDLDLSNNNLQDSGVKLLSHGLTDNCKLEKLRLSDCSITEEGYKALASALRSNTSHLIELDLRGNDPGPSGVKQLNDLLLDPKCKLETLRFLSPDADEAFQYVNRVVGENPLLVRELNLSERELDPKQLVPLLVDKHCKLNILILNNSSITEEDCCALVAALNSNPSNLKELVLSGTKLRDSEMKNLSTLFENVQCRLEKLKLNFISITKEYCTALASAFNSNPSNLNELDLSGNQLGDSGVMEISTLLGNSQCTLQILRLSDCSISEEGYKALASALRSNPSHLIELDLKVKMTLLFNLLLVILFLLDHGVSGVYTDSVSVSVKEGDSVTLNTDVQTNQQEEIRWYFNDILMAEITGNQSKICTDVRCNSGTERFTDRLKLDHQTGSLTITDTRTTDAGLYKLLITSRNSSFSITRMNIFSVSVTAAVGKKHLVYQFNQYLMINRKIFRSVFSCCSRNIAVLLVAAAAVAAGAFYCRRRSNSAVPPN
ncbi:ribonuclease inhibitor-like, partial [Sinocyclocheilus rhinocerous]|uniref:ribonuclease inhibitor-like n=1 Tax=Sinocyclocheilus rhinocerous TaxID=307959 RepID=UPI0007B81EB7